MTNLHLSCSKFAQKLSVQPLYMCICVISLNSVRGTKVGAAKKFVPQFFLDLPLSTFVLGLVLLLPYD